jgi:hypothetical protein
VKEKGVGWGLFKWRGLSLGTGFIYHKSEINYDSKIDKQKQSFTGTGDTYTVSGVLVLDPSVDIGLKVTTYTVPVDIQTSFQLLWLLNLTLGAGVDFNFGTSDITLKSAGKATVTNLLLGGFDINDISVDPGVVYIDGSTKNGKPVIIRPRVNAGLGLNVSVVKLDVMAYYYPMTGAAVGVSAGIVW